ncbi:hypothetical protein FLX07_03850 [Microbispora bryophytorum]|nr:hypothetical protein FLX07_03850 [Microbispora bryophytorum]
MKPHGPDVIRFGSLPCAGRRPVRPGPPPGVRGPGILVDEAAVHDADKQGHAWRSPIWRYPDRSFAEW